MKRAVLLPILMLMVVFLMEACFKPEAENKYFLYQLVEMDIKEVLEHQFDYLVTDYSRDGSEDGRYSEEEISKLKEKGIIPLCYISIGEAEDYRFYWQEDWRTNPPDWLGPENPKWEGNYKVRYWYDEWKEIVFEYLDKIIEEGFSGIYLDIIDAYYYWSEEMNELGEKEAADKMIEFVEEIAKYTREKVPGFLIVPQNAEDILEYDDDGSYLDTISGIGVEDLFYTTDDNDNIIVQEESDYRIEYLDRIKTAGKFVLSVDYVYDPKNPDMNIVGDYVKKARKRGYIPYPANKNRALDEIVTVIFEIK